MLSWNWDKLIHWDGRGTEWLCRLRQILHLLKKKYTTYLLNLANLKFELTLHAVRVAAFALEGQPKVSYFTWLYLFRKRDDALIHELLQCFFQYFFPLLSAFHSCPSTSFTCANGRCVPYSDRCDHYNDCGDNSDEAGCHFRACNRTEFTCSNGRCIPSELVCDGVDNCLDNSASDEKNCRKFTLSS